LAQREFPVSPLVGVGAVIFDYLGRVLLIQRANEPNRGRWSIPGGLVELGEPILDALRREIREETGLSVEPKAVVDVVDRIYTDRVGLETRILYHYVVVDYWCRLLSGEARCSSDAADISWATASEWQNSFALDPVTIQVIQQGWDMARESGTDA
jgi:ADP-ribose pyrophosphatase YjhB (NUDIX family)